VAVFFEHPITVVFLETGHTCATGTNPPHHCTASTSLRQVYPLFLDGRTVAETLFTTLVSDPKCKQGNERCVTQIIEALPLYSLGVSLSGLLNQPASQCVDKAKCPVGISWQSIFPLPVLAVTMEPFAMQDGERSFKLKSAWNDRVRAEVVSD